MYEIEAYREFNSILNSLNPYSMNLTLDRIKAFCLKIGNPQDGFKSILVGGTNGKGSVCQYLTDCFVSSGYVCGTYTSPHLILPNERIRINNRPVDFSTLLEYAKFIQSINFEGLTYFEFLTVLAFLVFRDFGVDMAVLEVGMGGEFDATNVVDPILSVLTSISLDHEEHLGKTIKEIALTKSKIIKRLGVVSRNDDRVVDVIKRDIKVPVYIVDNRYLKKAQDLSVKNAVNMDNIAVTLLAIDVLNEEYGFGLRYDAIKKSFWPGRFQVLKVNDKTVVLDGAHNVAGMINLKNLLEKIGIFNSGSALVFSSLTTKRWKEGLRQIMDDFECICPVGIKYWLGVDPYEIEDFLRRENFSGEISVFESVNEALNQLLASEFKNVVIAGSLYLVGETLACHLIE